MSYPTYPEIPLPNETLGSDTQTPVSRTQMEGGQARQIARFSTGQQTYSMQFTFTGEEYASFLSFFYTTLNNGTEWFEMTVPTATGFDTLVLRFVGGKLADSYQTFDRWNVNAILESQINQLIEAPDTPLVPIWFQPQHEIFIDTVLNPSFANSLLLCQPSTGETIVLTVPEISTPSDWLPFGIINKGPGNVTIKLTEEVVPPEPSDTWMALAASMGAWGIYRFDTGAVETAGRLVKISDLSANGNDLEDNHATAGKRAIITGGWVRANAADNSTFRGFKLNGLGVSTMNLTQYHVLAIQRVTLPPATSAQILTTKQQPTGNVTGLGVQSGSPNQWAIQRNSTIGSVAGSRNFPTSGLPPICNEIISYTTQGVNFLVNGYCISASDSANQVMDCLQLGGRFAKDAFTIDVETAAVVIFPSTANLDTFDDQVNLAYLRKKMLEDFS